MPPCTPPRKPAQKLKHLRHLNKHRRLLPPCTPLPLQPLRMQKSDNDDKELLALAGMSYLHTLYFILLTSPHRSSTPSSATTLCPIQPPRRPTTLFNPQRDRRHRAVRSIKPIYEVAWYVPLSFSFFLFFCVACNPSHRRNGPAQRCRHMREHTR